MISIVTPNVRLFKQTFAYIYMYYILLETIKIQSNYNDFCAWKIVLFYAIVLLKI